jgi:hypothetical protein
MNTNCFSPKTFCRVMNKAGQRGTVPRRCFGLVQEGAGEGISSLATPFGSKKARRAEVGAERSLSPTELLPQFNQVIPSALSKNLLQFLFAPSPFVT